MAETFDWIKPSLLWQPAALDMLQPDFFRPALLEFRSDDFMKDFLAAAGSKRPDGLRQVIAQSKAGRPLKLFQPAHGNFYLTCASLCCRVPGFPDREVQKADGENTFFVLRKKVNGSEYGWVTGDTNNGWQPVNGKPIMDEEERLPLFPATTGQSRNIFFGYVPVSSQQTYAAASTESPIETADARLDELDAKFINPINGQFVNTPPAEPGLFGTSSFSASTAVVLRISIFLLLDLFEYFAEHLPEVASALLADPHANANATESALLSFLGTQALGGSLNLAQALAGVARKQSELDQAGDSDLTQSPFNFSLADYRLNGVSLNTTLLKTRVQAALDSRPETLPPPVKVPKLGQKAGDLYVLRYVYERPQCDPAHQYVSQPTEQFELAPFFDPDAPGRPIRIGLPVDVSIGGLRKFPKNVAFMMSKELRNKMDSIHKGMLKGDPPGGEGSLNIGDICSFSIPIITLIAFILLMIIAILLNIVFWWLPLLKICFPLKLSAKS
jgi:hypothetical protein